MRLSEFVGRPVVDRSARILSGDGDGYQGERVEDMVLVSSSETGSSQSLLVFSLGSQRYALPLANVDRVVWVVEMRDLPKAPEVVVGVIDVGGRVTPVIDLRRRFKLPLRDVELDDKLLLAQGARRPLALLIDAVEGVIERAEAEISSAEAIVPGLEYIGGVTRLDDELILIHDLDRCLSLDEEQLLEGALEGSA